MHVFSCTLLADGSSDRVLEPLLRRLLELHCPCAFDLQFAESLSAAKNPLAGQLQLALALYPCDLLFVHRDAEKDAPLVRKQQIETAKSSAGVAQRVIPVVPVRMTEAWLLVDEEAIRTAARRPSGKAALDLPQSAKIESLPDPKDVLFSALRTASELTGRHLNKFQPQTQRHRVAEHLAAGPTFFERLRQLPSFGDLEASQSRARVRRSRRNDGAAVALQGERQRRHDRPSIGVSCSEPAWELGPGFVGDSGERCEPHPVCEIESNSTPPMALPFINDGGASHGSSQA